MEVRRMAPWQAKLLLQWSALGLGEAPRFPLFVLDCNFMCMRYQTDIHPARGHRMSYTFCPTHPQSYPMGGRLLDTGSGQPGRRVFQVLLHEDFAQGVKQSAHLLRLVAMWQTGS